MSRTKQRSILLPIVAALLALAAFGSVPFFLKRETASQQRQAVAKRVAADAALAKAPKWTAMALGGTLQFNDAEKQSREFIGYYHSITLTPEQEGIKKEVLGAMPAACCSGSTAYTCCCPCNLSKTIWGLSNYVIARRGADAKQLRGVVDAWTAFVNPNGYTGSSCYRGGCDGSLSAGGCGAMQEDKLIV